MWALGAAAAVWLQSLTALPAVEPTSDKEELPVNTAAARKLLTELGTGFGAEYSPHFTVISDSTRSRIRKLLKEAEETYQRVERFGKSLSLEMHRPKSKMPIVFFDKWDTYARHAQSAGFIVSPSLPGFFDQRTGSCTMFNYAHADVVVKKRAEIDEAARKLKATSQPGQSGAMEQMRRIREMEAQLDLHEKLVNATVLRHELAHQAMFHLGIQTSSMRDRRWLCEGLAMQFESEGHSNKFRRDDFLAIDWESPPFTLRSIVGEPHLMGPGAKDSAAGYATAWALVHFLIDTQPESFARYIQAPVGPASKAFEIATFEQAFGRIDAAFTAKWHEYVERLDDK